MEVRLTISFSVNKDLCLTLFPEKSSPVLYYTYVIVLGIPFKNSWLFTFTLAIKSGSAMLDLMSLTPLNRGSEMTLS